MSFSLYGGRFLTDLRYSQYQVNAVSIIAELALYLLVPFYGYICDRYSPRPLSLLATVEFGAGYLLAAYTYKAGPPPKSVEGGTGWPFGIMMLAFVGVGSGTSCMYLASVATCAKNYANSRYRGFAIAIPISAFGLSAMWQSQVGAHLLNRKQADGSSEVDVFRYFIFLGGLLMGVGVLGFFFLRIVDEESLIDHGIENLERSGLLEESDFFHRPSSKPNGHSNTRAGHYGTIHDADADDDDAATLSDTSIVNEERQLNVTESMILKKGEEQRLLAAKKSWLLNHATLSFLTDRTMWLLALGFFLLTGPAEAYINNVGTIIPSLQPRDWLPTSSPAAGTASTHVSIIALSNTAARLFTGTVSDLFAPQPPSSNDDQASRSSPANSTITFSRLSLLLPFTFLPLLGFLNLSLPFLTPTHPSLFPTSTALLGLGYGAAFSLVPIIVSVVWGAENFATNWGIVAMMPAPGAAIWSLVYSVGYETAAKDNHGTPGCIGRRCFEGWGYGCAMSVGVSLVCWATAWRSWRRSHVVI